MRGSPCARAEVRNHRTVESKNALGDANVYVVDISSAASCDALKDVFRGCDALVIATSATPVRALVHGVDFVAYKQARCL